MWPRGVWCDMVGEVAVWASSVPENVGGVVGVVEVSPEVSVAVWWS